MLNYPSPHNTYQLQRYPNFPKAAAGKRYQPIAEISHSINAVAWKPYLQGGTRRCRTGASWLTNSCGVSASEYSCAYVAQIIFEDLTQHLTYDYLVRYVLQSYPTPWARNVTNQFLRYPVR